ncbi:MAG: hypothetical protein ACRCTY_03545 [Candidatus Adiutrix sp.]
MPIVKIAIITVLLAVCGACGKMPAPSPPHLAGAKDSLNKGNHLFERGCHREAALFFQEGLEFARLSDNVTFIIQALNSQGAAYLALGKLEPAAAILEQALQFSLSQKERPELDKILANLGTLAYQSFKMEDAENFWLKAIEVAENKKENPAAYICNLARLYFETKRQNDFKIAAEKALKAALSGPNQRTQADALNLNGHLAALLGQNLAAESFFKQSLSLDRKTENTQGLAQNAEDLAHISLSLEKIPQAVNYLDRAFYLRLYVNDLKSAKGIFDMLAKLHKEGWVPGLNIYEKALQNPSLHGPNNNCL